jgi:hypothetical protein
MAYPTVLLFVPLIFRATRASDLSIHFQMGR